VAWEYRGNAERAAVSAQAFHLELRLVLCSNPELVYESSPEPAADSHQQKSHAGAGGGSKIRRRMSRGGFSGHR
jgi:hypothetical protein